MYSIKDLLPYPDNARLKSLDERIRVLMLLDYILQSVRDSIRTYLSGQYIKFDAHVGENLCQIRAYQLVQIIRNADNHLITVLTAAADQAERAQDSCASLLDDYEQFARSGNSQYSRNKAGDIPLLALLEIEGLNITLPSTVYFLTQLFILSGCKLVDAHHTAYGTDYGKLCDDMLIPSRTFSRKVIHNIQRNISKLSCQYIFKLINQIDAGPRHVYLLQSLYHHDELGRHVMPCYEVTKTILQHAYQSNYTMKVVVTRLSDSHSDKITFVLVPDSDNNRYVLYSGSAEDIGGSGVVFIGIAQYGQCIRESKKDYVERFMNVGFEDIILANMAQHPQYPGILLRDKKYTPYSNLDSDELLRSYQDYVKESEALFLRDKLRANSLGCSQNNESLFLVKHIKCEMVSRFQVELAAEENVLVEVV